jgi:hypothetical protein
MATERQAKAVLDLISNLIKHPAIVGYGVQEGLTKKSGSQTVIYLSRRIRKGILPHEVNGVPIATIVVGKPRIDDDSICFRGKTDMH